MSIFCPSCGAKNDDNAAFCNSCGAAFARSGSDAGHDDYDPFSNYNGGSGTGITGGDPFTVSAGGAGVYAPPVNGSGSGKNKKFLAVIIASAVVIAACIVVIIVVLTGRKDSGNNNSTIANAAVSSSTAAFSTTKAAATAAAATTRRAVQTTAKVAATTAAATVPSFSYSTTAAAAQDGFLFPSDSEYISDNQLDNYSRDEILIILNEMYARHGYIFKDTELSSYFSSKSWYHGTETDMSVVSAQFNTYEKENMNTIVAYQTAMGWR